MVSHNRGARALDEARAFYQTHYHFPSSASLDAYTAYVAALTHMRDHNEVYTGPAAPRLYIRAARAQAGKTLLCDFAELTGGRCRVYFTPVSTYWGITKAISDENMCTVLDNFDHVRRQKHDYIGLLIGGAYEASSWTQQGRADDAPRSIYGPVIYSAIGGALRNSREFGPAEERSIVIDVDAKPKGAHVERFDRRDPETLQRLEGIRRVCARWGRDVSAEFATYRAKDLPEGLDDRPRDMWEPLIAACDLADGRQAGDPVGAWGKRIRRACRALALGQPVEDDEDGDPFVMLTPAQRSMVECSHVLAELEDEGRKSITSAELLARMAELPGGDRWSVPAGDDWERVARQRTMALSRDLATFGVERSSVKVPIGEGEYRNGWWAEDVLPLRDRDGVLPRFSLAQIEAHRRQREEDEVPF